jgi:hypothetical protein
VLRAAVPETPVEENGDLGFSEGHINRSSRQARDLRTHAVPKARGVEQASDCHLRCSVPATEQGHATGDTRRTGGRSWIHFNDGSRSRPAAVVLLLTQTLRVAAGQSARIRNVNGGRLRVIRPNDRLGMLGTAHVSPQGRLPGAVLSVA